MPRLTGNRCQCPTCGEYFNGVQPFDHHRIGQYSIDRRCLTVAELDARGWVRNAAGFWCERAMKPRARPRAPVFPASRAPSAMQHHCPTRRAPETPAPAGSP